MTNLKIKTLTLTQSKIHQICSLCYLITDLNQNKKINFTRRSTKEWPDEQGWGYEEEELMQKSKKESQRDKTCLQGGRVNGWQGANN